MPGFSTHDDVINAVSAQNRMQTLLFNKRLPSTTVANVPHTFWLGTGLPSAGTTPTVGMAGAVACDGTTAGALKYTNPTGGRTMHLLSWTALSNVGGNGQLILVDRLAHANIANAQATASFSPVIDGTARLAAGEGAQIILEVTTALSAASNTRTFTYTNQAGTASQVTPNLVTVSSAVVGRVPYADFMWVPLAAGDTGVRSIESTTLVSGTATGNYNVVLVKPLAVLPLASLGQPTERDFVVEMPSLPQIRDNSCLQLLLVSPTAAVTVVMGDVRIAEN